MTLGTLAARARGAFGEPRPRAVVRSAGLARLPAVTWLHATLPLAIAGTWAVFIAHVRLRDMTDLGLISVLPRGVILLLFLLTVSFCVSLTRRPLTAIVPLLHVIVLIVILYGITALLEEEPRFAAAWKHVGIVDYILHLHRGTLNSNIDAFFNWPGFFALGALITKTAGFPSALAFTAWGPLVFNLLFLAPLVTIFRWASDDRRVTWLGLWVFYSTNWVAQDYTSPQAVGYTLWLSILAALLTWFTPRPQVLAARLSLRRLTGIVLRNARGLRPSDRHEAMARQFAHRRAGLLLLIVVIYGATVAGHQLTPVSALLTVIALVLFARLETRGLPVIMAVLLAAWISYMTTSFLAGHFSALTGPIGHLSQNLSQSVSQRVTGSHDHLLIVHIREVATVAIWLLAVAGLGRRLRAGRADIAMAVVAGAPFLQPVIQPYGGEILLRVFLFALPAVSFFIAGLAFPSGRAGRSWFTMGAVALLGCVLLGVFQYTRYGNERLDYFTQGDFATVQAFYRIAPRGSTVYGGAGNLPWRYRDYAAYKYRAVTDLSAWNASRPDPATLAAQLRAGLASSGGGYVIVTRSTKIEAELLDGRPRVLDALVALLRASPAFRELYRNRDGELFYEPAAQALQIQPRNSGHRSGRSAPHLPGRPGAISKRNGQPSDHSAAPVQPTRRFRANGRRRR